MEALCPGWRSLGEQRYCHPSLKARDLSPFAEGCYISLYPRGTWSRRWCRSLRGGKLTPRKHGAVTRKRVVPGADVARAHASPPAAGPARGRANPYPVSWMALVRLAQATASGWRPSTRRSWPILASRSTERLREAGGTGS